MKPIFCIDVTENKKNENFNGGEFITRTISKQKLEDYEEKQGSLEETVEKSQIPLWLKIVKYLCALFFLFRAVRKCTRAYHFERLTGIAAER